MTNMESEKELLALLEELNGFEKNFKIANRFNIFDAVNMGKQEVHHSRFLAFLLNPAESHGLGSAFLRRVLLATAANSTNSSVSKLSLSVADLSGALVYCERDHIDITVEIPELRLMFAIENKIDALERTDQLKDYRELIEKRYPQCSFMGCFLTPDGYPGADEEWIPLSYASVATELQGIVNQSPANTPVVTVIQHYIDLIEKKIMASEELISACRRIYTQHRAAFNLIMEHGQVSVLAEAFQSFQSERPNLAVQAVRQDVAIFVESSWLELPAFQIADTSRWEPTCPIKYWFQLGDERLRLFLEVGPAKSESGFRRPEFVQALGGRVGRRGGGFYTRIHRREGRLPMDADIDTVKSMMDDLWQQIGGPQLEKTVREAAEKCI
jgi:hypothetical protein